MSLLEDVFLEDEAGEAQDLERIIEGDEFDERPRSASPDSDENSAKEDEAEDDKRRVDPTQAKPKRVIKNPRFILNPARLTGPRGIQVLPDHFKEFKFKGKGYEKEDLDIVLKKLEHWAYRLYPKFGFEDCLKKIETLGKKRPVMVHLHKIRTDQFLSEETVNQKDSSDEEENPPASPQLDEFDVLLQQQIDLARATPAPQENGYSTKEGMETPLVEKFTKPTATLPSMNEEQRERMLRNRRLAEEKRLARLKQNSLENKTSNSNDNTNYEGNDKMIDDSNTDDGHNNRDGYNINDISVNANDDGINASTKVDSIGKKNNKSNVIDSSDEETDGNNVGQSIIVDVHDTDRQFLEKSDENVNDNDNIKNNHKSNVIDSSDEETDNFIAGQSITVDICHNNDMSQKSDENLNHNDSITEKNNKSKLNYSSDEETDDNNVADQSITAEIHRSNEISQMNKNDNMTNKYQFLQANNNMESSQFTANETNDSGIIDSASKVNELVNNDKLQENDVAEDVVDVDFSDDF